MNGDGYSDVVVGSLANQAWVFLGNAGGLGSTPDSYLTGPTEFGTSVAGAGDVNGDGYADVVIGSRLGDATATGAAAVYLGSASGLAMTATSLTAPVVGSWFGTSVACAGDVNGDGYADLVVGAPQGGLAYVYTGGAGGIATTPSTSLTPPVSGGNFGNSVASAGDVNGDGYADVVIANHSVGSGGVGAVYLYLGGATGLATVRATSLGGPDGPGGWFGRQVAGAGDVNGDGHADVVVGAPGVSSNRGKAYVYLGTASGLGAVPTPALTNPGTFGYFGESVASASDRNGESPHRRGLRVARRRALRG